MPQTSAIPTEANVPVPQPGAFPSLASTVQFLVFDPGLFILDLTAAQSTNTDMGFRLPAIRLDTTPPTQLRPGRAVVTGAVDGGWIWRTDEPVFVLVTGGRAGMLLTIYRTNTAAAAPEIRFRQISTSLGQSGAAQAGTPTAVTAADTGLVPLTVLAHVRVVGDVTAPGGAWLGKSGSNAPIEGFSIAPGPDVAAADIEYQAVLGNSWNTPWFAGGEFCGSRGMLLPLLGFRVRLKGAAAAAYACHYQGHFAGSAAPVVCVDGEVCAQGDAPLEAIQVTIVKRETLLEAGPVVVEPPAAKVLPPKKAPLKKASSKQAPPKKGKAR